jgi:hypothetical protein
MMARGTLEEEWLNYNVARLQAAKSYEGWRGPEKGGPNENS